MCSNPVKQISSVRSGSQTSSTPTLHLGVSCLMRIPMACAVAIVFDAPLGKLYKLTSMPFRSTWISLNRQPHDPLLTSVYWSGHHTHKSETRSDFPVPTKASHRRFLTNLAHSRTSQDTPTPNNTENPAQYRTSSPHTQTFHLFSLITTSGRPARPSQETIVTYSVTWLRVMTSTKKTSRRQTSARSRRNYVDVRLTIVGNNSGVGGHRRWL